MFSLKSENIPFWSFSKRSQMLHSTHAGPPARACRRMDARTDARSRQGHRAERERSGAVAAAALVPGEGHRSHQREETPAAPNISSSGTGPWLWKAHLGGTNLGPAVLTHVGAVFAKGPESRLPEQLCWRWCRWWRWLAPVQTSWWHRLCGPGSFRWRLWELRRLRSAGPRWPCHMCRLAAASPCARLWPPAPRASGGGAGGRVGPPPPLLPRP